jgi:hypothetical protein
MALLAAGGLAERAAAKGMGMTAAGDGVAVAGSPYRYAAMSPPAPITRTVVVRTDRDGGRIDRWWYLRGTYFVPAVAYDLSGGGLSADGSTLVLSRLSENTYPPPVSRFAILDTERRLRRPWDPPEHRASGAVTHIALEGDYSFDAISPDGSTVYLTHRLPRYRGGAYIANHEIRALDAAGGELLPEPVVAADRSVDGVPITRASSPDGRWAYTLYDGNTYAEDGEDPFVLALDTVAMRTVRVELPLLARRRNLFMLKLRPEADGRELAVVSGAGIVPRAGQRLLTVDTRSFEVAEAAPASAPSGGLPWPAIAISAFAALGALAWIAARGRRGHSQPLESA